MSCERSRRGRPRLAPEERRTEVVAVALTAAEAELLVRAAAVVGSATLARWARARLIEAAARELREVL